MKRTYRKIIRNRKQRIQRRLDPRKAWSDQPDPMFGVSNIHYEMADKTRAINCGGIGAIQTMVNRIGLCKDIDGRVRLLKRHLPYHESDHVLNLAYNAMLDGARLQDIEIRRNDEAFLDALGAQRIPDPTTSGDFTRRFSENDIIDLMDAINTTRKRVWQKRGSRSLGEAFIDVDGTIAGTLGECKGGMNMSYKGVWGYAPLLVTLANTNEVLYLVNRPGNATSSEGCAEWINRAIDLVSPHSSTVTVRGDTDFTNTGELDGWDAQGIKFILGIDAHPKLVRLAQDLDGKAWQPLARLPRYEIKTRPRRKAPRVKEELVRLKEYQNKKLQSESIAEIDYRPHKCRKTYRVVIVRKNISVEKGEKHLFDEIRYFFYITNRKDHTAARIVGLANGRCNQENVIEQLKNGVNAMRMPVNDLLSNWAYMVMTALAWNLKAWFGLLLPDESRGAEIMKMEFRRFMNCLILLPAQIIRSGRRIIFRIQTYNSWLKDLFAAWEFLRTVRMT